jgi:hypothetical protein
MSEWRGPVSAEDFYLLVPEDEWVEERLSRRRSWDDHDEFEVQSTPPTIGPSADVRWYLWTGVALALWRCSRGQAEGTG